MQLPPFSVIAAWPTPNYTSPTEVRGPTILILTLIFVPMIFVLVALRTYTRLRLSKNFGADDIVILAALLPTLACSVITVLAVLYHGWSRHVWDIPPDQLVLGLKLVMAVEILFSAACSLTKLSMLLLINRVMAGGSTKLRRLSIGVMVLVGVEMCIFTIVVINTCNPVSDYWTLSLTPQNCINEAAHLLTAGLINSFTDFCVVLIPIPVVMKLRLPLRQRIFCAMLFGAGFIVCIAGGFRIGYTYLLTTTYDKTWLAFPTWISGTIELYLGIIATSIPAIKPFISRYFPWVMGSTFTRQGTSSYSNGNLRSLEPYVEQQQRQRHQPDDPLKSPLFCGVGDVEAPAVERMGEKSSDVAMVGGVRGVVGSVERRTGERERESERQREEKKRKLNPVVSAFSTYRKSVRERSEKRAERRSAAAAAATAAGAGPAVTGPVGMTVTTIVGGGGGGGGGTVTLPRKVFARVVEEEEEEKNNGAVTGGSAAGSNGDGGVTLPRTVFSRGGGERNGSREALVGKPVENGARSGSGSQMSGS